MEKSLSLSVLFVILYYASALSLPSEFEKCNRSDPKRDECLKSAIQNALPILEKGLPEFNLESISPIKIPSLTIGAGTGPVHVVQNYKNVEIHDVALAKIDQVESTITDTEFKLAIEATLKEVNLRGQYNFDGNIMFMKIVGDGDCSVIMRNTKVIVTLAGEIFEKKNKKYIEITSTNCSINPGKVEYDFKNLFNGDPVLGPQMNTLLNDNWKDIYGDVASGYEEALQGIFQVLANLIFKRVPYDEMFPK